MFCQPWKHNAPYREIKVLSQYISKNMLCRTWKPNPSIPSWNRILWMIICCLELSFSSFLPLYSDPWKPSQTSLSLWKVLTISEISLPSQSFFSCNFLRSFTFSYSLGFFCQFLLFFYLTMLYYYFSLFFLLLLWLFAAHVLCLQHECHYFWLWYTALSTNSILGWVKYQVNCG